VHQTSQGKSITEQSRTETHRSCNYLSFMKNTSFNRDTISSLQAGRAIAALLVVLYHNGLYIFALDKYWGFDPAYRLFNFGHAGVEFFFVLSGFIIFYIHGRDLDQPSRFFAFVRKRFIRIYPIYWLMLAVITPIYFLVPSFGFDYHRTISTIVSSTLLIYFNENLRSEIAVAWTLYHEILFYFIFSLVILSKQFGLFALTIWLLASIISLAIESPRFLSEYLFSHLHLLFGMGMLACWILQHRTIKVPGVLAIFGTALFIAAGLEEDYVAVLSERSRDLIYGLGSMIALMGWVELERQGRLHVPSWLQLMGNASYAIYLTHFTVLSLLAKIFIRFRAQEILPAMVSYILLPVLAVLFGIAVHLLIEWPLLRKLQRYRKDKIARTSVYGYMGKTGDATI
jgi:exopolysaccharide production protein ExoZ